MLEGLSFTFDEIYFSLSTAFKDLSDEHLMECYQNLYNNSEINNIKFEDEFFISSIEYGVQVSKNHATIEKKSAYTFD